MITTLYIYIPRSKSVLLERLLDYTDIPHSKCKLHQMLMKYIDIPCSKSVLHERGLIHGLRDCRTVGAIVLLTLSYSSTTGLQEHSFYCLRINYLT